MTTDLVRRARPGVQPPFQASRGPSASRRPSAMASLFAGLRSAGLAAVVGVLALSALSAASGQAFCEKDGLIIIEVESAATTGSWVEETAVAGSSGTYYRWTGPNHFNSPGNGVLSYQITVTTPGTYNLRMRNYHDHPDHTLENDCWTRVDGGPWTKTFSHVNNKWTWATIFESHGGGNPDATYFLSAGTHTFDISGRSFDFRIDKINFFLDGAEGSNCKVCPETICGGTWTDLGNALAGVSGPPTLSGVGEQLGNDPATLTLTDARPNSVAFLILGLSVVNVPFKAGVLVPAVDLMIPNFPVDAAGETTYDITWPPGLPSGFSAYFQFWIADPAAPFNFSASNGLQSTTP